MPYSDDRLRIRLEKLEREAVQRPRLHRLRLLAAGTLGYAYPAFMLAVCVVLFAVMIALLPVVWNNPSLPGHALIAWGVGVLAVLALTGWVFRGLMLEAPQPGGELLPPGSPLAALVEDVRRKVEGPPLSEIRIDYSFNAAVIQRAGHAFFGRSRNVLLMGIPMLAALTPDELRLVLAHEFGHLDANHGRFTSWIYRSALRWQRLANLPATRRQRGGRALAWFLDWYPSWLWTITLPLRRRHEHEADLAAARLDGGLAARVLMKIEWLGNRLQKDFWPGLWRGVADEQLPPSDYLQRLIATLQQRPDATRLQLWRAREARIRTHIEHEHPCLRDRLAATGHAHLLEAADILPPTAPEQAMSALALIGSDAGRLLATGNASWKASAIANWRAAHARAQAAMKEAASTEGENADTAAEKEWNRVHVLAAYRNPGEAISLLQAFVAEHPGHAASRHRLGELMLASDDERGIEMLEEAVKLDSDYAMSGLMTMLEYYRDAGSDVMAAGVQKRLEELDRTFSRSRRERVRVRARDTFLPHDLPAQTVEKIARVLYFHPRVKSAWLVRKQVRHVTDKPAYVLAIMCVPSRPESDRPLAEYLSHRMPVYCTVVALGGFVSRRLRDRIAATPDAAVYGEAKGA